MSEKKIELLAPAGSMEQGQSSIASGCDAIYGGLREWNARSRAKNLSEKEYRTLLETCRKQQVKFYLTVNTLIKENELEKILTQLSRIELPDAIIATDIGFISLLLKEYPLLAVHASTQFGAYTIEDLIFLERLGIKRAILARELTLSEIAKLRAQSSLELETFVYGSQCMAFSGQCLWSGLTQECSGNRGRCAAPCRDFYGQGDRRGQFLYPQDLNAVNMIAALSKVGVNSIKLEGRYRDLQQTAEAVARFRRAIDGEESAEGYSGYLSNKLPVKGMLNEKNPRKGNLKSSFTEWQSLDNDSAAVFLTVKNQTLNQVEVTDNLGNIIRRDLPPDNPVELPLKKVAETLKSGLSFKIHEITANVAKESSLRLNEVSLKQIMEDLNRSIKLIPRPKERCFKIPGVEDYLQVDSASCIKELMDKGYRNFILEANNVDSVKIALKLDSNIIYRLPLIDFNHTSEKILPYLAKQRVMITRPSQLLLIDKCDFAEIIGDYTLNVWNSESLKILQQFGVKHFTAHPELAIEESNQFSRKCNADFSEIRIGRIPLGYTRACFGELGLCDKNCGQTTFELKNLQKGYELIIECKSLDHRVILSKTLQAASTEPRGQGRYLFSHLSREEMQKILEGNFEEIPTAGIYGRSVQ